MEQTEAMQSQSRKIEPFIYPEIPWTETLAELSDRFAELFPGASNASVHGFETGGFEAERSGAKSGASSNAAADARAVSSEYSDGLGEDDLARLIAVESQKAEERGRIKGMEMGLAVGRDEMAKRLEAERDRLHSQAAKLVGSFAEERDRYFHQLEHDAVQLALAMTARILRCEAQMDPLLLTGAVRVALGQLAESTAVRLHVPTRDQPLWEEALARMPGLAVRPNVIGDPRMELGDCRMETELGSADLGLWPQLKEIERGFFDRVGDPNREMRVSAPRRGWEAAEATAPTHASTSSATEAASQPDGVGQVVNREEA
jgi:flagellar biosynthesis/type III secretory pathway protein FliH